MENNALPIVAISGVSVIRIELLLRGWHEEISRVTWGGSGGFGVASVTLAAATKTDLHFFNANNMGGEKCKIENDNSSFYSGRCHRRVLYTLIRAWTCIRIYMSILLTTYQTSPLLCCWCAPNIKIPYHLWHGRLWHTATEPTEQYNRSTERTMPLFLSPHL